MREGHLARLLDDGFDHGLVSVTEAGDRGTTAPVERSGAIRVEDVDPFTTRCEVIVFGERAVEDGCWLW